MLTANCDVVFIVSALNRDWNPRRIQRALAMVVMSRAQPVLLLTKLDLCPDPSSQLQTGAQIAPGVPVHTLSQTERQQTLDALAPYLLPGQTLALIGTSGVGKSTLVNSLLGEERAQTGAIRAHDDRGRHTTTRRELYALPCGALVIDTARKCFLRNFVAFFERNSRSECSCVLRWKAFQSYPNGGAHHPAALGRDTPST